MNTVKNSNDNFFIQIDKKAAYLQHYLYRLHICNSQTFQYWSTKPCVGKAQAITIEISITYLNKPCNDEIGIEFDFIKFIDWYSSGLRYSRKDFSMNSIKFLLGMAVIGLTLAGFILMDPAFKNTLRITYEVQSLSTASSRLDIEKNTVSTEHITFNLAP